MATCRSTVNTALRKLGRLAAGREARPVDAEDAFEAFKGMLRAWINGGAFGRLWDVVPTASYTAYPSQRILIQDNDYVVTLPTLVPDWCYGSPWDYGSRWVPPVLDTTRRDVHPPRDGSVIVICNDVTGLMNDFIYDGTIKQWLGINSVLTNVDDSSVQPMTLDSLAPLSVRDPQGLASCLAIRISDEWGAEVASATVQQAQRFEMALANNFSNPREPQYGTYF